MVFDFCSLCGVPLTDKHRYCLIKDQRDILDEYKATRLDLCDTCYQDLMDRRDAVYERLKSEFPDDGGLSNVESGVIEFS